MINKSLVLLFCFVLIFASCKKESIVFPSVQVPDNDHLLLGNPTNAVTDPQNITNYLKDNVYYKLGYNGQRRIATWVSWHFQHEDLGNTPRQDDYRPDLLPFSSYAVSGTAYSGSGFDRGHNCPSGDRTISIIANSSTFLMTNILPQAPLLNQGPWEGLEDYMRNTLVGTTGEAFVVMGNYGSGGKGSVGTANTIDGGQITVPAMIWKLIVVLPKGNNDLQRVDTSAIVLVVNMPNNNDLYSTSSTGKSAWRNYLTTVTSLEQSASNAGVPLKLLENVNISVRSYLKNKRFY
jgi:endonuclease G, mitochondrial